MVASTARVNARAALRHCTVKCEHADEVISGTLGYRVVFCADCHEALREEELVLEAYARGEPIDPLRHKLHAAEKAETLHHLRVEQTSHSW